MGLREVQDVMRRDGSIYVCTSYQEQCHEMMITDGNYYAQRSGVVTVGLPSLDWAQSEETNNGEVLVSVGYSATGISMWHGDAALKVAAVDVGRWHKRVATPYRSSVDAYNRSMDALINAVNSVSVTANYSVIRSGVGEDPYVEWGGEARLTASRAERWAKEMDGTTVWVVSMSGVPGVELLRVETSIAAHADIDVQNWRWVGALRGLTALINVIGGV